MNYAKAIIFVFSFAITLLFFSCEKGTEPEELKPGRRDYVWEVDTLKAWNTYLMKLWGSSPTDIWAVGHGCCFEQNIWHYDGDKWTTDGVWRGIEPWCIYGFTANNVWIGGSDGKIWHYNGVEWSESLAYSEELNFHYYGIYFMDIWGENPDDVYAVGFADSSHVGIGDVRFGIMMHYNGTKWSRVNIEFKKGIFYKIRKASKTSDKYYIHNLIQFPDSAKYFEFDGEKFREIYHGEGGNQNLTIIDDEVLFGFDRATHSYTNNKLNQIVINPFADAWNAVYGKNRKDIIWMMSDGLTHYNGTNFEYILNFDQKSLSDGFVFENEAFFVANDFYNNNANNLIYHGVLK